MLIDTIVLERGPGELRAALLADGAVWQVDHYRDAAPSQVGAIYRGRVTRVDPGINGAFVTLGEGADGFLRARDAVAGGGGGKRARIGELVHEGAGLVVQVTADAHGDKGPRLSADIRLPGYLLDLLPAGGGIQMPSGVPPGERDALVAALAAVVEDGEGARAGRAAVALVRHAPDRAARQLAGEATGLRAQWQAALADADRALCCLDRGPAPLARVLAEHGHAQLTAVLVSDHETRAAARRWAERYQPELADAIDLDPAAFERLGVDAAIDAGLAARVTLPSGAGLVFEAGETLTAIDVDSGRHQGRAGRMARDIGREAVSEIARQLRLRALGGAVVVDLLKPDRGADRQATLRALRAALADDPARCHVLGVSHLGLIELTRQRRGPTLAARLLEPVPAPLARVDAVAYGALRALVRQLRAVPGRPHTVVAAGAVVAALEGPLAAALAEAAAALGGRVTLRAEADWPRERVEIVAG